MFYLTQHDTSAAMRATLEPAPINLTGATVTFSMRLRGSTTPKITKAAAVIEDAPNGVVRYDWQTGDTDENGQFEGEFEVTYADASVETFPNAGYIDITIKPEIA